MGQVGWGFLRVRVPPPHMHAHVNKLQMAANMFVMMWSLWSPHGPHHPHIIPIPPFNPHPRGDPGIIKNSIRLELIKIFQFCLKI